MVPVTTLDTGATLGGKKGKKKKDPNEPQKPVSAYALFFRDTQAAIKGQNPNATFGEVSKIVASMWDSLGEEQKQVEHSSLKTDSVCKKCNAIQICKTIQRFGGFFFFFACFLLNKLILLFNKDALHSSNLTVNKLKCYKSFIYIYLYICL